MAFGKPSDCTNSIAAIAPHGSTLSLECHKISFHLQLLPVNNTSTVLYCSIVGSSLNHLTPSATIQIGREVIYLAGPSSGGTMESRGVEVIDDWRTPYWNS